MARTEVDDGEERPMLSAGACSLAVEDMSLADLAFLRVLLQLERDARAGDIGARDWLEQAGYHGQATEFRHPAWPYRPAKP